MAKYRVTTEAQVIELAQEKIFERGDILVHKFITFADMQALLKRHYSDDLKLFPASPGTKVYTINGYNTSVIEEAGVKRDTSPPQ